MQTLLDSQQQPRKPRVAAASLVAAGVIFSLGYALGSMHTGIAAHQMLREASGGEREKAGVAGDGFANLGGFAGAEQPEFAAGYCKTYLDSLNPVCKATKSAEIGMDEGVYQANLWGNSTVPGVFKPALSAAHGVFTGMYYVKEWCPITYLIP